jgi:hypothetical protein
MSLREKKGFLSTSECEFSLEVAGVDAGIEALVLSGHRALRVWKKGHWLSPGQVWLGACRSGPFEALDFLHQQRLQSW